MPPIILDAHQDIAYNAFTFGRDYRRSALVKRREEEARDLAYPAPMLGLPEALAGRVAVVFATLFNSPASAMDSWNPSWHEETYNSPRDAYRLGMRQLDYYRRLDDESQQVRLITTAADLDAVLATWADDQPITARQQGLVILMEGADPIIEPKQFEEWYTRGVRIVGPAWSTTPYAAGNGKEGTLTTQGYELLDIMAGFKAILDISHLNENASLAALDHYDGTIIASHSNPRKFRDTDRHLTDTQIRKLAERGGVMGIVLYSRFLSPTWQKTDGKAALTLQTVADAIDHVCQLTGSADHVGIGSDFDGGFGAESVPLELDTVADLTRIEDVLRARGYADGDIEKVLSGNMLRMLRQAL